MPEAGEGEGTAQTSNGRIEALRALLPTCGIDALVVSSPQNVRYMSRFSGSSASLVISGSRALLITDSRYAEQASTESPEYEVRVVGGAPAIAAAAEIPEGAAGFESGSVSVATWESMKRRAGDRPGRRLVPVGGLVERLRLAKTGEEIALIGEAASIASRAFESLRPLIRPGVLERDLALELEFRMKLAGAEAVAFDLIVASGPRSALPHGRASGKAVGAGEFVVFDIGARYRGYHSDMTRTLFLGRPDRTARRIYDTVLRAQAAGMAAVRPGATGGEVDAAARGPIEAEGFGERFGHGTGHGVGLEVHEAPRIGTRTNDVLGGGMVITVEPGVYIPGYGGVRIEDLLVVEESGYRVLTSPSKSDWILE